MRWTDDTFFNLFQSAEELKERFDVIQTVDEALAVMSEEYREFLEVAKDGRPSDAVEEAIDLVVTLFGVLAARGVTYLTIQDAVLGVIAKNNDKTTETHYVNDANKIQRKGRQ